MIGARCIVVLPDGILLHGEVVAEEFDVTPAGGPAWRVRLDVPLLVNVPLLHPLGRRRASEVSVNKYLVHLEN